MSIDTTPFLEALSVEKKARKLVTDWLDSEGKALRFAHAHQSPHWADYDKAHRARKQEFMKIWELIE